MKQLNPKYVRQLSLTRLSSLLISFFIPVFFIIFSFFNAFGNSIKEERLKKEWRETGFNLDFVIVKMINQCHNSEKLFVACMMSFHQMVSSANKDDPRQLRVSKLNELEIVPYPEKKDLEALEDLLKVNSRTIHDFLVFRNNHEQRRRESFRAFFRSKKPKEQSGQPFFIKGFGDILQKSVKIVQDHVPEEDQPHFMGEVYNTLLQESVGPETVLYPLALRTERQPVKYVGTGITAMKYKTENENLNNLVVINPLEGSPAQSAGLKRGDLLLAVEGVSVKTEPLTRTMDRIAGDEDSQVTLTVQDICNDNKERNLSVTRKPITDSFDLLKDSYFINVLEENPLGCKNDPTMNREGPQALYVPLTSFEKTAGKQTLHLCSEFVELQKRDLQNPRSLGMILDLRENFGGQIQIVLCLLNTIIPGTDIMLKKLPVTSGQVEENDKKVISYHLTDQGPIPHPDNPGTPVSYNKHIVVLVDGFSLSASEIFAGIIQEKKRGWVVGLRSFGKGSVQRTEKPFMLPNSNGKYLVIKKTTHIYTFGNNWSPHNHGIIPDFYYSRTGQPIDLEKDDYIPLGKELSLNNIEFTNYNSWTQNRPDELAELDSCVHGKNTMSSRFLNKAKNDERYNRPFIADYHLELAKDILTCSAPTEPYRIHQKTHDFLQNPFVQKTGSE